MAGATTWRVKKGTVAPPRVTAEPRAVKIILIAVALSFLALLLLVPLGTVFWNALKDGLSSYWDAISASDAVSAIELTLFSAAVCVPLNTAFGLIAAWAIARFDFVGKQFLMTAIELPFSVSPVISGMIFVLLFGAQGIFGEWLSAYDVKILFTPIAIFLASLFVTFPFVARELIPLMQSMGADQEEAALTLGANGWQAFFHVTLPNIRWGLLYGVILLNARVMGEFGAVSVVSGHIRGHTNTLPLHVEILYNEYNFVAAFAAASLLAFLALATLVLKSLVEWRSSREARAGIHS